MDEGHNVRAHMDDRQYFERLLEERDKRLDERFRAQERALDKAEMAMTRRLDSMNEIRDQLNQQQSTFLRRDTFEAALSEWSTWREQVNQALNISTGNVAGRTATRGELVGVLTIGIAAIGLLVLLANYFTSK